MEGIQKTRVKRTPTSEQTEELFAAPTQQLYM